MRLSDVESTAVTDGTTGFTAHDVSEASDLPIGPSELTPGFTTFCERERDRLTRALVLALDHQELGRDAAAEGLARAWERWGTVSTYDNPAGWVYRVGLNWGRSRLRKRSREVTTALVPERSDAAPEHDDRLVRALASLSADHRTVVVGRYYLDWSEAELAAALDIPAGTVKSRLSRALEQLARHLEAHDG